ncbi:MAG: hypothetical protein KAG14_03195 [Mycoplasmataceae bacterium]|nr:hypothetical protein [Mycoplasmataceae bacterium]
MTDEKKDKPVLSKIERLKIKQGQLNAQIVKEKNKEKVKIRKADTRRKIIMGALSIAHMENDAEFRATCERLQQEGIKGDTDRALFNLEPLEEQKPKEQAKKKK